MSFALVVWLYVCLCSQMPQSLVARSSSGAAYNPSKQFKDASCTFSQSSEARKESRALFVMHVCCPTSNHRYLGKASDFELICKPPASQYGSENAEIYSRAICKTRVVSVGVYSSSRVSGAHGNAPVCGSVEFCLCWVNRAWKRDQSPTKEPESGRRAWSDPQSL